MTPREQRPSDRPLILRVAIVGAETALIMILFSSVVLDMAWAASIAIWSVAGAVIAVVGYYLMRNRISGNRPRH